MLFRYAQCNGRGRARGWRADTILEWLHEPVYVDLSPRTVFAMLLDAGRYLASVSSFYRLLRTAGETRGHRDEVAVARRSPGLHIDGLRRMRCFGTDCEYVTKCL